MRILAEFMAILTGTRFKPKIYWRSDSVVHNLYALWRLIFWEKWGIRHQMTVSSDGVTVVRTFHTWESFLFHIEEMIKHPRWFPFRIHVPMLQTTAGFVVPTSPYLFAIAFDAENNGSGTPPSFSVTVGTGSSNYVGSTWWVPFGTSRSVSASTWAGASMTQSYTVADPTETAANFYMYYKINPASGAQTVTGTCTASYGMVGASFSGVDQTTPFDTNFDGASHSFNSDNNTPGAGASSSVVGTTHVNNSLAVGQMVATVNTPTAGAGTQLVGSSGRFYDLTAVTTPAGTAKAILTNPGPGNSQQFLVLSALQPAASASTTTGFLTLMGVGS